MKNTDKNTLTSDDICKIIKACADSGVANFKLNTLSIEFWEYKIKDTVNFTQPLTQDAHDKMNTDTLASEEIKTKEERVQMLLIEDPLLAEEMILNGDLENDGTGSDADEEFVED